MLFKSKRIIAAALAMVLFANISLPTFAAALPFGSDDGHGGYTVTDGQLVSINYDLSDAEKVLLSSGYVEGASYNYTLPTKELVTIDQATQKVEVKVPSVAAGMEWVPVKAELVVNDVPAGDIALTKNGDVYTGSFSTAENTYTVSVEYKLTVNVPQATQGKLLNTIKPVKDGVAYLTESKGQETIIKEFQNKVPEIVELGKSVITIDGGIFGTITIAPFTSSQEAKDAIALLDSQMAGDNELTVYTMLKDLGGTAAKLNHIVNTSDRLDLEFITLYNAVNALKNSLNTDMALINLLNGNPAYQEFYDDAVLAQDAFPALLSILAPLRTEQAFYAQRGNLAIVSVDDTLGAMVDGIGAATDVSAMGSKNPLEVGTITVVQNANLLDAKVVYTMEVSDGTKTLVSKETKTSAAVKVSKDMADADIVAMLEGNTAFKAEVLAAWGVSEEELANHFVVTTNKERVESDFTYTVSYSPKTYTIDEKWDGGADDTVPYGFVYSFAFHPDHDDDSIVQADKKGYVYSVNGVGGKDEGTSFVVTENVAIDRNVAKAKTGLKLTYAVGTAVGATAEELKVLGYNALKPTTVIGIKYPGPADATTVDGIAVFKKGEGVTAKVYDSGYTYAWVPYQVSFDGVAYDFPAPTAGQAFVAFTGEANEVVVTYRLQLDIDAATAEMYANYPYNLSNELKGQHASIKNLRDRKGTLDSNMSLMPVIKGFIEDEPAFPQATKDAFKQMLNENFEGDNLKLSVYLGKFETAEANGTGAGLRYYYTGGKAELAKEVSDLLAFCNMMKAPENVQGITNLINKPFVQQNYPMTYEDFTGKLDSVINLLNDYNPGELAEEINPSAADAQQLFIDLVSGSFNKYPPQDKYYLSTAISPFEEGKANVVFKVMVDGSVVYETIKSFSTEVELSAGDAAAFDNLVATEAAKAVAGVEKFYYGGEVVVVGNKLTAGVKPTPAEYTVTWSPVTYTIEGEGFTSFTKTYGENPIITFDIAENRNVQYTFAVNGMTPVTADIGATTVSIPTNAEQLHAAATVVDAANGKYKVVVTRTSEDVSKLVFDDFIVALNKGFEGVKDANGANKFGFMPYETVSGEKVVVMRTTYEKDLNAVMGGLAGIVMDYPYIEMGGKPVIDGAKFYLQNVVDLFVENEVGMETLTELMDDKGNIKQLNIAEEGIAKLVNPYGGEIKDADKLGGKVLKTTMKYGSSATSCHEAVLYITLEHFDENPGKATLLELRNTIAGVIPYLNINGNGEGADVVLNLPESIWAMYLTGMMVENETSFDTLADYDMQAVLDYMKGVPADLVNGLAAGEKANSDKFFTTTAIENTIKKAAPGRDMSFAAYGNYAKLAMKFGAPIMNYILAASENGEIGKDYCKVDLAITGIKDKLSSNAQFGAYADLIADDSITVNTNFVLKNLNNVEKYEAYVIELPDSKKVTKDDIKKAIRLSANVTEDLAKVGNNSYVMLLKDVTLSNDVNIKGNNVIIDLNGKNITGNLNATGTGARIVDNTLSTKAAGVVTGNLTGNFTVYAGKYTADVSAMLPAGHIVEDGYVRNVGYLLEESGNEYKVILSDGLFDLATEGSATENLKQAVVNVIFNLGVNFFPYNSFGVKDATFGQSKLAEFGNESLVDLLAIYNAGKDAMVKEALTHVYPKGAEIITNGLLAALDDFDAIAGNNGQAVYSTGLTMNGWDIMAKVTGTDMSSYIDLGFAAEAETTEKTLSFYLEDDSTLKDIAQSLGNIVVIEPGLAGGKYVELGDEIIHNGGHSFSLKHAGAFEAVLDLTVDENYPIILATIVGNGVPGLKAELVEGVNKYVAEGLNGSLKKALNKMTMAQLITALEKADSTTFAAMFNAMGYTMDGSRADAIKALEKEYTLVLKVMYKLVKASGIDGNDKVLGGVEKEDGVYSVEGTVSNVHAKVTVKLFSSDPEIKELTPNTSAVGNDKQIYRYLIDETRGLVILDTRIDGITEAELEDFFLFTAHNSDMEYIKPIEDQYLNTITPELGVTRKVIRNGAQFTIVAENNNGATDERTYTLIILGDTNSSGAIEVGDATRIRMHTLAQLDPTLPADKKLSTPLTAEELIAADSTIKDGVNVGDCVVISTKWVDNETDQADAVYAPQWNNTLIK